MQRLFGVMECGGDPAPRGAFSCEAPGLAEREGITVALRGRPYWRGGKELPSTGYIANEVLQRYCTEGIALLKRLHGSFALAILDNPRKRATLAVDRMGIGRLAHAFANGRLIFSSSAEAVARELSATPSLSRQALFDYFFFHMVPSPATIFADVQKLPPASVAVLENGQITIRRYWEPVFSESERGNFEELRSRLHSSLRAAVRCTGPQEDSGAFLSGGLDSSTVAGVLSEFTSGPAKTFSIGFGCASYDELEYARIANRHFGLEGHEYVVNAEDIAQAFATIARTYDEPFGNSSALPAYYCAQLAAEHGVRHLLAGDGGDELFAGNTRYARQKRLERYNQLPALLRRFAIEPALDSLPNALLIGPLRSAKAYVSRARVPPPDRFENWNPLQIIGVREVFDPDFLASVDSGAPIAHMRSVYAAAPARSPVNRSLYYDWRLTLADNDLRKVEAMCDLAGVCVSYPMLHPDVIEVATKVPPEMQLPGLNLRGFYKQAMIGFLPDSIIHKQKHGFGLPFGLLLQNNAQLRGFALDRLCALRSRNIVRGAFVDRLLDLHSQHDAEYYGAFVWVLAMLEQWLHERKVSL